MTRRTAAYTGGTLQEWCERSGIQPERTQKGTIYVHADRDHPFYSDLFRLDDYTAKTVGGTVVWLTPREHPPQVSASVRRDPLIAHLDRVADELHRVGEHRYAARVDRVTNDIEHESG